MHNWSQQKQAAPTDTPWHPALKISWGPPYRKIMAWLVPQKRVNWTSDKKCVNHVLINSFLLKHIFISFVHRSVTEGCKVINTTHRIPILFHYDISLKHTFSQILQQDQFSTLTKTKIKLQAVKYCLFQPSPLTPQCPLNSNLLTSCPHNPAPGPSKHPQFFRTNHNSKKSYLHLSIKDFPPHTISVMTEIISL